MMIRRLLSALLVAAAAPAMAAPQAELSLTRLECGKIEVRDLNMFSDTMAYTGQSKTLVDSCYLIRHGDQYMIWDTGLPAALKGKPADPAGAVGLTLSVTIADQLKTLGLKPEQVKYVGISHYHFDHLGQAASFPQATLLIGASDWDALKSGQGAGGMADPAMVEPWIKGGSKVEVVAKDKDVFGDGSVMMLDMRGHTPGHHVLLVRLKQAGPVLLTGDLTHFTENYLSNGIPGFNHDRADSLASLDRFKALAANLGASVIIQHEPADVAKLPAFPKAAY